MPYITPLIAPASTRCWRISIPDDERILASILGQLLELTEAENWEQDTGITVDETTTLLDTMFETFSKGQFCMIGALVHYVTTTPPNGILACDGTQYLRVDYPVLYANLPASLIIDADNFVTPTIEDKFLLAAGLNNAVESVGGTETHALDISEMPPHDHESSYPNITVDIKTVGVPNIESASNPPVLVPTTSVGGGLAHENMPPFVAYNIGIIAR